ncbi:PAS domain-containing protein [Flammeovirgaceae bacterium SG7u.111]|nr:PAS domain-containing protein [Flammeovirgaceae bacterium SG7u.132]WPO36199.1 PAS domain-containing protein [Flammeovirgaceae bacterium SG7u.111]
MKTKGFPFKLVKKQELIDLNNRYESISEEISQATEFIKGIEEGKLDKEYDEINTDSQLTVALLSMRDQLKKIAEEERERNWATEGLARFVDILRNNTTNINELGDLIISHVVKYLGANQGGLFTISEDQVQEEDVVLEMVACYAYERKKHMNKKVGVGEGLLGQAYLEKDTIYMTDLPEAYMSITSGLGKSNPKSLLIVPLKVNDNVYGVMELASFKAFPPYQIEFLEKLGENIASTLSTVKINERTQVLLEDSQMQAEQMRAQEEEMRQNMEELQATQEEMTRKQQETEAAFEQAYEQTQALMEKEGALNDSYKMLQAVIDNMPGAVFWKDKDLNYLGCNKYFAETAGFSSPEDIIGKSDYDLPWKEQAELYREDDAQVMTSNSSKIDFDEHQSQKDGSTSWLRTSKIPLANEEGVFAILGIFRDITEAKNQQEEAKKQGERVDEMEEEIQRLKQQLQEKESENEVLKKKIAQ